MLLKRLLEFACGLSRLLWLFGRERRGSREASAAEQLLNMKHSHGPAFIYNVNMLVERWLQWKRWIDWALDKSFNGCVLHCRRVDFILVEHRLMVHVCSLGCSCVCASLVSSLFVFLCCCHWDEVLWKGSLLVQLTQMISVSVPLLSSDTVKYCCPINGFRFRNRFVITYSIFTCPLTVSETGALMAAQRRDCALGWPKKD